MTKQEIIEETVKYYKNNPFGYNPDTTSCVYLGSEGQMCAVGRCMLQPEEFGEEAISADMLAETQEQFDSLLKEQYRGHEIVFWNNLQNFHDNCAGKSSKLEEYQSNYWLKKYYDRQEA